jgi:hypothetical protein
MFNLEAAIVEWRQQMLKTGLKSPVPLDELENHLREEIDRQMKSGTGAQTAFEKAIETIGAGKLLKSEFEKVDKEARAAKQAKLMLTLSHGAIVIFAVFIGAMLFFRIGEFSELTARQQMSVYAALGLMLLFGFGGRLGYKLFPNIGRKKIRETICVSAGVLLALWWTGFVWGILPRHEYTMAQLLVVIVWSFVMPSGLMLGLGSGLEMAARKSGAMNS